MINNRGLIVLAAFLIALTVFATLAKPAPARDDGRYAGFPLKPWFDQLASKKGLCCSFADGVKVENVDWDTQAAGGIFADAQGNATVHYRVRLCAVPPANGETWEICSKKAWFVVPDSALITEPNKFGPAVVWPYAPEGKTDICCFMPGAGA